MKEELEFIAGLSKGLASSQKELRKLHMAGSNVEDLYHHCAQFKYAVDVRLRALRASEAEGDAKAKAKADAGDKAQAASLQSEPLRAEDSSRSGGDAKAKAKADAGGKVQAASLQSEPLRAEDSSRSGAEK